MNALYRQGQPVSRFRNTAYIPLWGYGLPLPRSVVQGMRIINLLDAAIYFSQIISLLPHTNLTNLTKTASLKARSCRLCRVFTNRMASTSVASALREIREICVKIKCL